NGGMALAARTKPQGSPRADRQTERQRRNPALRLTLCQGRRRGHRSAGFRFALEIVKADLEIGGRLVTPRRILAQTPLDDPFELARQTRPELGRPLRVALEDGGQRRDLRAPEESALSCRHFVEHSAKAENV